jgi:hypothetical protein
MPDTQQVEVYNPQGKLGTIPSDQLTKAKAAGYKSKDEFVEAVHPKTGQTGIIPKGQWDAAQKQGYVMSPREQQRAKAKAPTMQQADTPAARLRNMFAGKPLPRTPGSDEEAIKVGSIPGAVGLASLGTGSALEAAAGATTAALAPTATTEVVGTGILGPSGEALTREVTKLGPSAANKYLKSALPALIKKAIGSYGAYEVAKKLGVPLP